MKLIEFLDVIKKTGKISGNKEDIGADLCIFAGATDMKSNTVKAWVYEKRNPNVSLHFPTGVKEDSFIQYFRELDRFSWHDLQNAFRALASVSVVDCDTNREDEFYRSLFIQFCELIGSPLPKGMEPPRDSAQLCHILPNKPACHFGRNSELATIDKAFSSANYVVLTGISGIGKSRVALAYAYRIAERGGHIVQIVQCNPDDTLRAAVNRLRFDSSENDCCEGDEGHKFNLVLDALRGQKHRVLIILDNFDSQFTPIDNADLRRLTGCSCVRILITSQMALVGAKQSIVQIGPLDNDSLLKLYSYHRFSKPEEYSDYIRKHKETLNLMFERVQNHTLMVELLAKLPMKSGLSECEIIEHLNKGPNISSALIGFTKDDSDTENTIHEIVKSLFSISQLSGIEKEIMRHMSLVPISGIKRHLFEELTGFKPNGITQLIASNWIIMDEDTLRIRLHSIIWDVVLDMDETKPHLERCSRFLSNLKSKLQTISSESSEFSDLLKIVLCVARNIVAPHFLEFPWRKRSNTSISSLTSSLESAKKAMQSLKMLEELAESVPEATKPRTRLLANRHKH